MKTTNIYYILDCSHKMQGGKLSSMSQNILKVARALKFANSKTNLHVITYRDRAKITSPFERFSAFGNPNLGEGLKALESAIRYQRKIDNEQTRSIFILHASDNVLQGWNKPSKDSLTSENSHSVIATSFHTEAPTSTQNKLLRASRTPMRKYCLISQKAGCAVLYATQSNIRKRVLRNTELFFCLVCYTKETLEE